jgi:hypothetical protein
MAQIAAPELKVPAFTLPKLDLEAVFALHKANLAAVQEAQAVLLDAAQAIVRVQAGYAQELAASARDALASKQPKKPEAVLAEVKAAAEKALATAKQGVALGVAAQRRVVELAAARTSANVEGLQALAA